MLIIDINVFIYVVHEHIYVGHPCSIVCSIVLRKNILDPSFVEF